MKCKKILSRRILYPLGTPPTFKIARELDSIENIFVKCHATLAIFASKINMTDYVMLDTDFKSDWHNLKRE